MYFDETVSGRPKCLPRFTIEHQIRHDNLHSREEQKKTKPTSRCKASNPTFPRKKAVKEIRIVSLLCKVTR